MKGVRKFLSLLITFTLLFQQVGFAQIVGQLDISNHFGKPGAMAGLEKFRPLQLRYFSYDTFNDSFRILMDKGDSKGLSDKQVKEQSKELMKYFLVGVSLSDDNFWVNLRPDSESQVISQELAKTDVGKILLEADLQLKKDLAKFTSPQTPEGKAYWTRLYEKANQIFGSENISIPTLTRPWIIPGEVIIRQTADSAYVYKASLKVVLEQDHLKNSAEYNFSDPRLKELNEYSSQIIREEILPKLTQEVNSAKRYASLRQVFNSLILARWFKAKFAGQDGAYPNLINTGNLKGLTSNDTWSKTTYFNEYKNSFAQGEYNIKEQVNTITGPVIRTYFSGGVSLREELQMPTGNNVSSPLGTFKGSSPVVDRMLGPALGGGLEATLDSANLVPNLQPDGTNSKISSPIVAAEAELPSNQLQNFAAVVKTHGLQPIRVMVKRIRGQMSPAELFAQPQVSFLIGTSVTQALGSRFFAGGGKAVKEVADANAVKFTDQSIRDYVATNTNAAVVIVADEGKRDNSVSLEIGSIYYSGYKGMWKKFSAADLEKEIADLKAKGVTLSFFIGDALEVTNGLVTKEAVDKPTDSWSLSALLDESNPLVNDNSRIGGTSFNAPSDGGVTPFDLPSVALPKIAKAKGINPESPEFAEFMNHTIILTLGPRAAKKDYEVVTEKHRHQAIIDDARKLQEQYSGLRVVLPGDGDLMPRVVSTLGLDLDGYQMITFGRSGSAEGTAARLIAAVAEDGQFPNTYVSGKSTNDDYSLATAYTYTEKERGVFQELGIPEAEYLNVRTKANLQGKGILAMTAVTGASEGAFGKSLSELLQRVTIVPTGDNKGIITTNTLVVTRDGSAFVVQTQLQTDNLSVTQDSIMRVSPEAQEYISKTGFKPLVPASSSPISGYDDIFSDDHQMTEEEKAVAAFFHDVVANWAYGNTKEEQINDVLNELFKDKFSLELNTQKYQNNAREYLKGIDYLAKLWMSESTAEGYFTTNTINVVRGFLAVICAGISTGKFSLPFSGRVAIKADTLDLFLKYKFSKARGGIVAEGIVYDADSKKPLASVKGEIGSLTPEEAQLIVAAVHYKIIKGAEVETSSPVDNVGGIDFRSIPMITQPMGSLSGLSFNLPKVNNIDSINLNTELAQMQKMLAAGIMPSGERLKEYVAACYQKGELETYAGDIAVFLSDICKFDEERVAQTSNEVKETMLIIDSLS